MSSPPINNKRYESDKNRHAKNKHKIEHGRNEVNFKQVHFSFANVDYTVVERHFPGVEFNKLNSGENLRHDVNSPRSQLGILHAVAGFETAQIDLNRK